MIQDSETAQELAFEARGLSKVYGSTRVLDDVSLFVSQNEILGIIGPSGGGKSTLLRCLDGLEPFDEGVLQFHGVPSVKLVGKSLGGFSTERSEASRESILTVHRRQVGYVCQTLDLWEERTLVDNLTLAPRVVLGERNDLATGRARQLCKQFGIDDKLDQEAWRLSGGQRQRAAIVRALMMRPRLLLLDEITSALDPVWTVEVMQAIRQLRQHGLTLIIVTHHLEFASSLCDRLLFLSGGRVIQIDTPMGLRDRPASPEVAAFLDTLRAAR